MKKLTAQDCEEIYYALHTKCVQLTMGKYDFEGEPPADAALETGPWIEQLLNIMAKIGIDGRTLHKSQK